VDSFVGFSRKSVFVAVLIICRLCLGLLFLALLSFLCSFLLGHRLLFGAFSHTQFNHRIKVVEVEDEVFGSNDTNKTHLLILLADS
jgi:hypothetical protein